MKVSLQNNDRFTAVRCSAFTLVESLVAMGVAGVMMMSLYAGITSGFYSIRLSRENLRATQVMLEKMEVIRLLTWDQITSSNALPSTFTAGYYPNGSTNTSTNGVVYSGRIGIRTFPMSKVYSDNIKRITVQVSWTSGGLDRSRQLTTYVARYGIQNYIFN